jgi:predicted amidohydrolase
MKGWHRFIITRLQRQVERQLCSPAANPRIMAGRVPGLERTSDLVRLAALQPSAELRSRRLEAQRAEALANAFALLSLAAEQKADLVLLPERFPMRGVRAHRKQIWEWAQEEGDELFNRLAETAKQHQMAIVAPVDERHGGRLYNAAWVFNKQGEFLGRYCKVHCTAIERSWGVTPGDEWPVFDLGFGKIGIMICHDMAFPESARCLTLNGAQLICWPHNQSGWGDITWDAVLRARAIDNGVYILASCCGTPANRAWRPGMVVGMSGIVAPDGTWLANAGRGVGIAVATVPLNDPRWICDFSEGGLENYRATMLRERRIETYGVIVKTTDRNSL